MVKVLLYTGFALIIGVSGCAYNSSRSVDYESCRKFVAELNHHANTEGWDYKERFGDVDRSCSEREFVKKKKHLKNRDERNLESFCRRTAFNTFEMERYNRECR